jgi:hypothetical protein
MIAALAVACRPHGAPRWDAPGVVANIAKIKERSLADVAMAVLRAANDRNAKSPGVIPTTGPHWSERLTEPSTREPKLDPGERCTACGKAEGHRIHTFDHDHEFAHVREVPEFDVSAITSDIRQQMHFAPPPVPRQQRTLDELADTERVRNLKAQMAAAAQDAVAAITEDEAS